LLELRQNLHADIPEKVIKKIRSIGEQEMIKALK
jgi:hypothetical protein